MGSSEPDVSQGARRGTAGGGPWVHVTCRKCGLVASLEVHGLESGEPGDVSCPECGEPLLAVREHEVDEHGDRLDVHVPPAGL